MQFLEHILVNNKEGNESLKGMFLNQYHENEAKYIKNDKELYEDA